MDDLKIRHLRWKTRPHCTIMCINKNTLTQKHKLWGKVDRKKGTQGNHIVLSCRHVTVNMVMTDVGGDALLKHFPV